VLGEGLPLDTFTWPERVALLFGAEGPGLSAAAKTACDQLITIPMARADSLNVATAGALFLHDRARRAR
jgi:tRNA G18 (ribose-2'-O)-methylase SpoU